MLSALEIGGTHKRRLILSLLAVTTVISPALLNAQEVGGFHISMRGGKILGGHQAVVGAVVRLFEAGTTGYGSAPTILATTLTDSHGSFDFGDVTCSSPDGQTFITAEGGDAGQGVVNTNLKLISAIGRCDSTPTFVVVNELTTAATTYALARFTNPLDADSVGTPATNAVGLDNASRLALGLVDPTNGGPGPIFSTGMAAGAKLKLNSLADALVSCVDSPGPDFTPCDSLYAAATPPGGAVPTNTLQASLNVALNPTTNVQAIYNQIALIAPEPIPYTPFLSSTPLNWILSIEYTNAAIQAPNAIAIDADGAAWVLNMMGGTGTGSLLKISPGAVFSGPFTDSIVSPFGAAIDASGIIWVTNQSNNTITGYNSSGALVMGPFDGLSDPRGIAVDFAGHLWVANVISSTLTEFDGTGTIVNTYVGNGLRRPYAVAVGAGGSIWASNAGGGSIGFGVSTVSGSGGTITTYTDPTITLPFGLKVSSGGKVWIGNFDNNNRVTAIGVDGSPIAGAPYNAGGVGTVTNLTLDGLQHPWVSNFPSHSLTALKNDGTPLYPDSDVGQSGLIAQSLTGPRAVAIDPSGNVWTAGGSSTYNVVEMVGIAAPTKTPVIGPPVVP